MIDYTRRIAKPSRKKYDEDVGKINEEIQEKEAAIVSTTSLLFRCCSCCNAFAFTEDFTRLICRFIPT